MRVRATTPVELLISDGIVEEFAARVASPATKKRAMSAGAKTSEKPVEPVPLSAEGEALAARLKEWRASEAKRLRVPAYVVLHDRTLAALAAMRPENPKQMLEIDGIGPAKVDKFGEAILAICAVKI
jgi:superfamily II DNA helicase RecQ